MAGSISLSMSQRFDKVTSKPLSGGLLYFIQAGTTSTPQNAFQDYGLTLPHPNPITLDAGGNIPAFYLADGFIKIRLTDASGVEQIVQDNLLVIGPSSGSGGGGGGVDPTTVFQVGDVMWLDVTGARSGWVRDNGRTIGSATSGATERANSDCEALFAFGWGKGWSVVGGKGASASADWAANKPITLPNKQGCVPGGLGGMGATDSGEWNDVPAESGDATTAGSILGENTHTLLKAELPNTSFAVTIPAGQGSHGHTTNSFRVANTSVNQTSSDRVVQQGGATADGSANPNTLPAMSGTAASGGSDTPHNTVQRTVLGTFYRKL